MNYEAGFNQVFNVHANAWVFWDQARVPGRLDHVLFSGPRFEWGDSNVVVGNWDPFDPKVNVFFIETNNFASGIDIVEGRLTVHVWAPCQLSLPSQNTFDFDLIASGDNQVKVSFRKNRT